MADNTVSTVKPKKAPPAARSGSGGFARISKYLGEVREQLKKTTFPTREELISQTQVVLGVLFAIGIFIFVWDLILTQVLHGLLRLMGVQQR